MRLLAVLSASTALLALVGAAEKPKVIKQDFDFLPQSYFYFEDSSVILFLEQQTGIVWRSTDDGEKWEQIKDIQGDDQPLDLYPHPFDKTKAYVLTLGRKHYKSNDQGRTWKPFETEMAPTLQRSPLSYHATKKEYILFTGMGCTQDPVWRDRFDCFENTFFTKDEFESKPVKLLNQQTHGCMFSRSTPQFNEGSEDTVLCIVDGDKGGAENWILLTSRDFFVKEKLEPLLDGYRTISGVTGLASVKKFILVAARRAGTDEMSLFVSDNAEVWDRAEFPSDHGELKQDAYTVLESTLESIQVDVLTTTGNNAIGALFTSNSNGTYFTKNIDHTNRNLRGNVDFEQVAGIEGIVLVNIVDNADEILKGNGNNNIRKNIKSQISFDGGRTFKDLTTSSGNLNLHSITDAHNAGRVFSSPAPGILMAIGNTGKYLTDYSQGNLYISNDAGLNWEKTTLDGPQQYEFGDTGSILVAIADNSITKTLSYSVNHGKDWASVDLGLDVQVLALTTVPDSSSKKFTMIAVGTDSRVYIFCFNFDGVLDRQCKKDDNENQSDYEKWYARLDENKQPDCLMGHKQYFWRRKQDSLCFVNNEFQHPVAEEENCPCTDEDYECDFEFALTSGKCELIGKLKIPVGACKSDEEKFEGPSGYRLIPGNTCKKNNERNKDDKVEWDCNRGKKSAPLPPGGIRHVSNTFEAGGFREYYYLGNDTETIVVRTDNNRIYVTKDQGGTWEEPKELKNDEITAIYPNQNQNDFVFFTTPSAKSFYTTNRFGSIKEDIGPNPPTSREDIPLALRFHSKRSDYIIWISDRDCEDRSSKGCHAAAYYTTGRGNYWPMLCPYVRNCAWIHSDTLLKTPEKLVFCEKYAKDEKPSDTNPMRLISSDDFFQTETVHFESIMGFATMGEFILAAEVKDDSSLRLHASIDGKIFAEAKFPHSLQVDKQQAYTLLDSVTHVIFLHVTVNSIKGSEYGALIKSNSNGTSYVLSLRNVNRNEYGFVDFEKMQGLEGVAIVNVVANVDETNKGGKKKLKSMITHNDGGVWDYLHAPPKDTEGKDYKCDVKQPEQCSLHLHGYTERKDPRDTFSSGSAVGLLVGVGNVGEYLTSKSEGNTYLTRDGGITWKEIRKGSYMWEYGDQGSIIALVNENEPTDTLFYTLDEGENWHDYNFGEKIYVIDITTIPSDTSRKFLIWGLVVGQGGKAITIQIDFTNLTDKKCELKEDSNESDFELWEPKHPSLDAEHSCLFGHHVQYPRKKPDRVCYIGTKRHDPIESEKCACERHDYECDFNYELQAGNKCVLVAGLQGPNHEEICTMNKSLTEWYEPTGYRRVPLTKCVGETKWDKGRVHFCPGHGASGWTIFFSVLASLAAAGGIGWYVWNTWTGNFGAIRLSDDLSGAQSPLVRYPIIAISAVVAVVVAIPAVVQVVVGWVASKLNRPKRYTTRSSFARGDYAVVDDGELLGSDEEDEV